MYKITFSKQAYKVLRKIPRDVSTKIGRKIKELALKPAKMRNVKKLTEHPGYRLRIGDWRVLYIVDEEERIIHIIKIKTRGEIYK